MSRGEMTVAVLLIAGLLFGLVVAGLDAAWNADDSILGRLRLRRRRRRRGDVELDRPETRRPW